MLIVTLNGTSILSTTLPANGGAPEVEEVEDSTREQVSSYQVSFDTY
jgi:hypothetical protein